MLVNLLMKYILINQSFLWAGFILFLQAIVFNVTWLVAKFRIDEYKENKIPRQELGREMVLNLNISGSWWQC